MGKRENIVKVVIDYRSLFHLGGVLIALLLLYKTYRLVLGLYIAFIIASVIKPLIDWLQRITKFKIKRGILATLVYVLIFFGLIGIFTSVVSGFLSQLVAMLQIVSYEDKIDQLLEQLRSYPLLEKALAGVEPGAVSLYLQDLLLRTVSLSNTLKGAQSLVGAIPGIIYVFLASWYFVVDRDNIIESLLLPLRDTQATQRLREFITEIELQLGRWAVAQAFLMLIIGVVTYIVLLILRVRYALGLAIVAGLLEIVPTIGPLISVIPALIIAALTGGVVTAVFVLAAYFLIQQLENSLIVPKVMQHAVGIHPLVVILAIAVGQTLAGVSGALLAVPTVVIIRIALGLRSFWDPKS